MSRSSRCTRERNDHSLPPIQLDETEGILGPQVGEPWPELMPENVSWPDVTGGYLRLNTMKDGVKVSRSLTVQVTFTTKFLTFILLAGIAGYAMCEHDTGLLKTIVRTVEGDNRSGSASESPP